MPNSSSFQLGTPALICRWRLAGGRLVLAGRHLRALGARQLGNTLLPAPLVAWVSQQVEWAFPKAAAEHPDGVLLLTVDETNCAALAVGPYEPLASSKPDSLIARAHVAQREAQSTGVAPETLWLVQKDSLICMNAKEHTPSGSDTLVYDLVKTWGLSVTNEPFSSLQDLSNTSFEEVFLISDEHGVVLADNSMHSCSARFAQAYATLLNHVSRSS